MDRLRTKQRTAFAQHLIMHPGIQMFGKTACLIVSLLWLQSAEGAALSETPPSWTVLPLPRYANYGPEDSFLPLANAAIVSKEGSPYRTVRTPAGELAPGSTIIEEELLAILKEQGVTAKTVADTPEACAPFDTLILLGAPEQNLQTAAWFAQLELSFDRWDDPRTPEDDFTDWSSLGAEGYVLKIGTFNGKTIILLAGHDWNPAQAKLEGAGTFYALQSFRQLLTRDGGTARVKTAEIADKPLVAFRGCYTGWDPSEPQHFRDLSFIAQMKANQTIYWYGNAIAGYNAEAASKFRYPWKPEQIEFFKRAGRFSREHFITPIFCLNPDHFQVDWAAARTFNGSKKDPLHYDLNHPVEPEFQEMWRKLGFDVKNDVDVLAAKFCQLYDAAPGALLQMMNEDDVFGLVHEADKQLYSTQTGDPAQDSINYGKARGTVLAALHHRIQELRPDYPGSIPVCPPDSVCYQFVLEKNEYHSREFMQSLGATLKERGLQDAMPMITTGGGTAAEVLTVQQIEDFRSWCGGAPVIICDNNFPQGFHIGAYETDPAGPRYPLQQNKNVPAGYRDKQLYKNLLGIHWNGLNDQHVLGWSQAQYMWNMGALERDQMNALAIRKSCSTEAYPLVRSFFEDFDSPVCYLPDNPPPYRILTVSDEVAFPGEGIYGWQYTIAYTDGMRLKTQRLCDKWTRLKPELDKLWNDPFEKAAAYRNLADRAHAFCMVYLAYGYLLGWKNGTPEALLEGTSLRDLYLEAEDIQERFFAGPDEVPGGTFVDRTSYTSALHYIYTDGIFEPSPESPAKSLIYKDIWECGLKGAFYTQLSAAMPGIMPDGAPQLTGNWSPRQESDQGACRTITGEGGIVLDLPAGASMLVRVRLGSETATFTDRVPVTLSVDGVERADTICKARWISWRLPDTGHAAKLTVKSDKPVRVYAVEVWKAKS
ncbi:MAG: hypothetical protein ACYC4N_04485 [Pirellulaceae bacterium]